MDEQAKQRFLKQMAAFKKAQKKMDKEAEQRFLKQMAAFSFFQIDVIADFEFEGKTHKNIRQRNNDSILTPENWEQHKETFFTQRMAIYKDSYTLAEKLKLELLSLEKLPINKTDYQILKDRYRAYLEQKQALPPQQTEKQKPELTINQIALKYVYSEIQITRDNGNEIAKEYGHNSGEKLFQKFTFYSSAANRKGKPQPCTPMKLKNKIELLESVFEHLPKDKRNRIEDEISILKNIQEAEYL